MGRWLWKASREISVHPRVNAQYAHTLAILKEMQIVLGTHNMKLCRNIFQGSNEPIIIGELPSPNA